ncbi:MAG: hypothetical protein WDW36_002701 [Sanguina aurantia]
MSFEASLRSAEIVGLCNKLLSTAGLLVKVTTEQEALLVASSTSLFVAAAEAVLSRKLEGIHRKPASTEERVANCDAVISHMEAKLGLELLHISAERVVSGNQVDTVSLLELVAALCRTSTAARPVSAHHGHASQPSRQPERHATNNTPNQQEQQQQQLQEIQRQSVDHQPAQPLPWTPHREGRASLVPVHEGEHAGLMSRNSPAGSSVCTEIVGGVIPTAQPPTAAAAASSRRHNQHGSCASHRASGGCAEPRQQPGEPKVAAKASNSDSWFPRGTHTSNTRDHDESSGAQTSSARQIVMKTAAATPVMGTDASCPALYGVRDGSLAGRVARCMAVSDAADGSQPRVPHQHRQQQQQQVWQHQRRPFSDQPDVPADDEFDSCGERDSGSAGVVVGGGGGHGAPYHPEHCLEEGVSSDCDDEGSRWDGERRDQSPQAAEDTHSLRLQDEQPRTAHGQAAAEQDRAAVRSMARAAGATAKPTPHDTASPGGGGGAVSRAPKLAGTRGGRLDSTRVTPHAARQEAETRADARNGYLRSVVRRAALSGRIQHHHHHQHHQQQQHDHHQKPSSSKHPRRPAAAAAAASTASAAPAPPQPDPRSRSANRPAERDLVRSKSASRTAAAAAAAGGPSPPRPSSAGVVTRTPLAGGIARVAEPGVHAQRASGVQAQRAPGGARVADRNRRQVLQGYGELQRQMDGRGRGEWSEEDGGQEGEGGRGRDIKSATDVARGSSPGARLSGALAAKLEYIHRLQASVTTPSEHQLRAEESTAAAECGRLALRREAMARQVSARGRRDAGQLRAGTLMSQKQQAHQAKVEALRLQRLHTQWDAAECSRRLKAATQQELRLREAFLEALSHEKERLIDERKRSTASLQSRLPDHRKALRQAQSRYQELCSAVEARAEGERRARREVEKQLARVQEGRRCEQAAAERRKVRVTGSAVSATALRLCHGAVPGHCNWPL